MPHPDAHRLPLTLLAIPALACFLAAGVFLCRLSGLELDETKQIADLQRRMTHATVALEAERAKVKALESRTAAARRALELANAWDTTARELAEQHRSAREDIDRIRRQLADAERAREQLAREHDTVMQNVRRQEKQFAVTALTGGRSLVPRPATFLECRQNGITIQPEGTFLGLPPNERAHQAFLAAVNETKYAVFLIRPDGYNSFRNYRFLLLDRWSDPAHSLQVGFEPVNQDWTLVYPRRDDKRHAQLDQAETAPPAVAAPF